MLPWYKQYLYQCIRHLKLDVYPNIFLLEKSHFRPRGVCVCSRDETKIWAESFTERVFRTCRIYFTIFLRENTDGTQRLILNVKNLNKYPEYQHFKIQTFQGILTLIHPNCYIATIELKDAYYSVNIDGDDTCFLKFLSNWKLFNFVFLPNGLSPGPPKFTTLLSISNGKDARIYSCNIHWWHNSYRSKLWSVSLLW